MKAVVLAGGLRSGLEVPGSGLPRALWPFPSQPLISLVLQFLKRGGCDQIAICANGKTKLLASELSNAAQPWTNLHYSEDPLPRGPAGCLRDLESWLGNEAFIVIQGTGFYDFDLQAIVQEHQQAANTVTVGARQCPDDADLLEPAGVYVVKPSALHLIGVHGYQDFKEQFLPKVLGAGMRVGCHTLHGQATLIHGAGHYLSAIREAIVRAAHPENLPADYRVVESQAGEPTVMHTTAVVHPKARITGPVWIDAGAIIEQGAVIAGPAVIGSGVQVRSGALIHRTVAMRGAVIHADAELFSTILGPDAVRTTPVRPTYSSEVYTRPCPDRPQNPVRHARGWPAGLEFVRRGHARRRIVNLSRPPFPFPSIYIDPLAVLLLMSHRANVMACIKVDEVFFMNTPALMSRLDQRALPQWNAASPGYLAAQPSEESNRQASRFAHIIKTYWWAAALVWAVIAIPACLAIYKFVPAQYVATGSINVAPVTVNVVNGENQTTAFYIEYLRTQAELMKDPYVLQRASEDIRLAKYDWFRKLSDQVGYLAEHVTVNPIASTQNIQVVMVHKDAEAAKAIVDSVLDAYLRTNKNLEERNVGDNLHILQGLQTNTDKGLKAAQEQLAKLTANGDSDWNADDRKVLADVLVTAKQTEAKLESDQLSMQAQLDSLKSRMPPDQDTYMASVQSDTDPQIVQWMNELIRVQTADGVLASKRATEQHPDRVEFRKQIKALTTKIADRRHEIQLSAWNFYKAGFELDRSKKTTELEADLAGVNQQVASLQKRITDQESVVHDLSNKTQPILALREQITDYKDALKRYNDRIEEIENQNQAPGRVTAAAPTVLPKTPTVDRRPKLALAANGLGLFLAMGVLVTLMKLRNKIDGLEDLHHNFQPLVVGTVSHAGLSARGLPGRMRRKILGEEMRLLHANLLPPGPVQRRLLMVTSPTPGNGKTSIASQLALSLAKSGLEVLLIDADMRKRDLSTMFDVGFRPGLAELLQGMPPELIRPVELLPNLRLMGAGAKLERNPVELFQRKQFHECLNLLQDKFDCVVIDTPPALVVADARLIARSCDEILCVVRAQVTSPKEVNQTLDALTRITGKSPKIILNAVEQRQNYYKYKFAYSKSDENEPETASAFSTGNAAE